MLTFDIYRRDRSRQKPYAERMTLSNDATPPKSYVASRPCFRHSNASIPPPPPPVTETCFRIRGTYSMMPLFIANFGSTLDELGQPVEQGEEVSIRESVEEFCIYFAAIGAVAGIAGFTMVSLWSIAGERQVRHRLGFFACSARLLPACLPYRLSFSLYVCRSVCLSAVLSVFCLFYSSVSVSLYLSFVLGMDRRSWLKMETLKKSTTSTASRKFSNSTLNMVSLCSHV